MAVEKNLSKDLVQFEVLTESTFLLNIYNLQQGMIKQG